MKISKIVAFSLGPIGGAALGLITLPIIAWFYSAEDIGRVAMLQVVSSFCILLFGLGLDQAYVREFHEVDNKSELLKTALLPGLAFLIVVLLMCLVRPDFISSFIFGMHGVSLSILVSLCILGGFVSRFLSLILRMQEKGFAYSMSQLLPKLIFLSVIGVYVFYSFGLDLLHLVVAHTLSILTVTFVYAWNTREEWLLALRYKINPRKLKAMLRFGAPLIMGGVAFWGLTTMDKLFLRSLSTFEELGIYSVATSFAAAAIVFQSIFSTVWAPTVYKWVAEGVDSEGIVRVTDYMLTTVVFLFALAGFFSWLVTYLLPGKYLKVQYLIAACMAYPLFYTLSEATAIGISITRRTSYSMWASVIAVLVNMLGNYLLVPMCGAVGAAISTAFAFWVFLVCRTEFSCYLWRKIPRIKLYFLTFACLQLAIFSAITSGSYQFLLLSGWVFLIFLTLALQAKSVILAVRLLVTSIKQ